MIDISTIPNVDTPTANLIYGVLQDDIIPGDGEGTPVREDWQSDMIYALYAVMNAAGVVADGSPEGATSSQFLTALRKVTKDTMYPVGSFYVQYPDAASNDDATAFPVSARPATMFGGTWVEQFAGEGAVFQTSGYDGLGRTNGLSADTMQRITGSTPSGIGTIVTNGAFLHDPTAVIPQDGLLYGSARTQQFKFDSGNSPDARVSGTTATSRTAHTNRLAKYWKRTVL